MMAMATSAQVNVVDSVEEWIPDSIEVDTVATNEENRQDLEISDCKLTNHYGLIVAGSKYGIRDNERKENVTDVIYDYATPAFRKKVEDEYITYFYIVKDGNNGIAAIAESTNNVMTIMSSDSSE